MREIGYRLEGRAEWDVFCKITLFLFFPLFFCPWCTEVICSLRAKLCFPNGVAAGFSSQFLLCSLQCCVLTLSLLILLLFSHCDGAVFKACSSLLGVWRFSQIHAREYISVYHSSSTLKEEDLTLET